MIEIGPQITILFSTVITQIIYSIGHFSGIPVRCPQLVDAAKGERDIIHVYIHIDKWD